jgi:hypothetical protein
MNATSSSVPREPSGGVSRALDPAYEELLAGLYMGTIPARVAPPAVARFRAESMRRRLHLSSRLASAFPRASFYATATLGDDYFHGVCGELIRASSSPGERLLARVEAAALAWAARAARPLVRALFEYEALTLRGEPYTGKDRERIRAAAGLPEVFALGSFDHDMIAFARHVDLCARSHAPPGLVREHAPIQRRQRVAVHEEGAKIVVRDVTLALEKAGVD